MKFTDEQKEVLELLPTNVKETNELTDAAKLILANLMYLNGTDFAKNEGYLFRTNQALMQDTGIKSEKTIIVAVNKLIEFGFIECKTGQRKSASEYRLNTVKMNEYTVKIHCKNEKYSNKLQDKNYSNKLQYKEKNTVINYSNDSNETTLIINGLQETIKKLQDKIAVMGDELLQYKNYSIKNYSENKNYSTDIDIDKEIETISKDNLLDNNNTEGRNSKEKNNIKEKSTKDNLEILKENSTVEIPNDEDIQRENESLDEIENTSKDKSSNNENLNESRISDLVDMYFNQTNIPNDNIPSESRIPSEDNISTDENPNDMPPLDVDCFFDNNSNQPTEYRDNENLNESRIPSEDGRIETTDNISDNENSKNNNLKTSENMKTTKISKGEISNKSNISNDGKISKKANSSNSFIHFGRLVGVCDMKGNVEEYLFNAYDTLKTADDFSEKFTETTEITIDLTQLEVSQDCGSGVWGMLSFNNGEYSFTQSNVNTQYSEKVTQSCAAETAEASNNVPQGDEIAEVDNHTTEGEKVAPVQSTIANKASENNAAPLPNSIKAWEKVNIYSHIDKKTYTMNEGFEIYKALSAKDIHSLMTWMKDFCDTMRMAKDNNIITEEQFNDFHNVFNALSRGKKKYWYNAFSNREPRKTMTSEMQMWEYLGKPKVNKADNKTVDNNKVYEDNVILPTHKDFETMNLDDIKNHLLTFVQEHPNLSDDKKKYVNDLCIAYTLEPQYVA